MARDVAGQQPSNRDGAEHGPSEQAPPPEKDARRPDDADQPGSERARHRVRVRHRLTQLLAVVVILAVFGFIFPRIASYSAAWDVVRSMTANWILTLIGVTVLNSILTWWFITTCLPGLSMPRAAAMNLSSTAVANTIPGGGAIALGVSWNMASAWGFSGEEFTLYTLVSGLWSQFAKFGTPAVALIALVSVGTANRPLVLATVLGTAVFLSALGAVIAGLHSDRFMALLGRFGQRVLDRVFGWFHRTAPRNVEQGFLNFKHHAAHLIKTRGWLMSASTLASDLCGWFVQLACLRACGVTAAEVSWEKSFAGYALIRLLTTIPITPGGLGITEVGLTAYLASGLGSAATDRIAAAILLARALTFVVPIPFGAVNFAVWRWLRRRDAAADLGISQAPEPGAESNPEVETDSGADSGAESDPMAESGGESDPSAESEAGTGGESDPRAESGGEGDSRAQSDSKTDPKAEPGDETDARAETESEAGTEAGDAPRASGDENSGGGPDAGAPDSPDRPG